MISQICFSLRIIISISPFVPQKVCASPCAPININVHGNHGIKVQRRSLCFTSTLFCFSSVLVQAVIIYALLHRTNIVIFTDIKCNIFRVTRAREEIVEQKAIKEHIANVLRR